MVDSPGYTVDLEAAGQLECFLDGRHAAPRRETRARLSALPLDKADGLGRDDYQDLVLEWTKGLGLAGDGARSFPVAYGGQDDPGSGRARVRRADPVGRR